MQSSDPVGQVFAANLRRLRQDRRWTLKETADELAVYLGRDPLSESGLSRWENPATPRRFSMTELFAICRVFRLPLARLFLPPLDSEIPTINDEPFFAVWTACFEGDETAASQWQQVGFVQRKQLPFRGEKEYLLDGFTEREVAQAIEVLRAAREGSADSDGGEGDTGEDAENAT